jgi:hypothetical protein
MTSMINRISAYMRPKSLNVKLGLLIFAFILASAKIILAGETGEPVVKNFSVDKKNKAISYVLTEPATVRLRVGSKSGPLYRTLVNWQRQKKGRHTVKWNGMDTSGTFNILDNKNFTFSFNYYLDGKENEAMGGYSGSDVIFSDNFIGRVPRLVHLGQNHKKHEKNQCGDLEAVFRLPPATEKTKEGLPKVKEILPITIELPRKDKQWFSRERFSINIFIDDVFVAGEALGYIPYTWNFNPKGINKGRHLITVNMKGFNDHIAVGSLPVYVDREE